MKLDFFVVVVAFAHITACFNCGDIKLLFWLLSSAIWKLNIKLDI